MVRRYGIVLMVCLALGVPRAYSGVPVIDPASIVQETISALEQVEQVTNMYTEIQNQVQQIQQLGDQLENMSGDYFKDLLLNAVSNQEARRWVPDSYEQVLDLYDNPGSLSGVLNAGWNANDELGVVDHRTIYDDDEMDSQSAQRWEQHEKDSMAAVGVGEGAFKRSQELIDESEALIEDISTTQDMKAALDLNNRIAAQNQLVLAELIRLQGSMVSTEGRDKLYKHSLKGEDKKLAQFDGFDDVNFD